jgi:hypothetical protein
MFDETTHVYLTPITAARADDFDTFLRDVVAPAVEARRPQVAGRWRALKPDKRDGDCLTYVFLFDGGDLDADWDLVPVFEEHYGADEAARLFEQWGGMAPETEQWAGALVPIDGSGQVGWSCTPVL